MNDLFPNFSTQPQAPILDDPNMSTQRRTIWQVANHVGNLSKEQRGKLAELDEYVSKLEQACTESNSFRMVRLWKALDLPPGTKDYEIIEAATVRINEGKKQGNIT